MSVELLRSTALSDNGTTYGSLSNTSFQHSEEETFYSLEMGVNSIPQPTEAAKSDQQKQAVCSCAEKGLTCHCKNRDLSTKTEKNIKLEPWDKYKTVAMATLFLLLVIWIAVFAPLKYKYNL